MSPNRKRKPGLRYASGRLRKPTKEEREEFEKKMGEVEMATVLSQPHRRGDRDQGCECALGRFFKRKSGLRLELKTASEHYQQVKRSFRAAWGAPTIDQRSGGCGLGPSMQTVERWENEISSMERAVISATSTNGLCYFSWLVLENHDTSAELDAIIISAMTALAQELGYVSARLHPFDR